MLCPQVKINFQLFSQDLELLDFNQLLCYELFKPGDAYAVSSPEGEVRFEAVVEDVVTKPQLKRPLNVTNMKSKKMVKPLPTKTEHYPILQSTPMVSSGSMGAAIFGRDLDGNYICPFPACGKWFPSQSTAQRHFKFIRA
ncbi:uncharacterized protein LOC142337310 [Convolutriloba macropyga]|uniref:uncharacterized protein LOC142337310 n=1 Tax=Convolutriloba macropyga TaxID=536237 RepID=UPI003F51DD29